MNRLVLLGNGFDLAHQMKSGYNDFILAYLKDCFQKVKADQPYEDELLSIRADHTNYKGFSMEGLNNTDDLIDWCYKHDALGAFLQHRQVQYNESQLLQRYFTIKVKSEFFLHLISKCSRTSWVAIENEFYRELTILVERDDEDEKKTRIEALNHTMYHLIQALEKYLKTLKPAEMNLLYRDILTEEIYYREIPTVKTPGIKKSGPVDKIMILNFNYTNTIEGYLPHIDEPYRSNIQVNYIHGRLGNPDNPIIFGFGDEVDLYYSQIENSRTKGFLKYIKSFWYFKAENYHDLIRFIDAEPFQVFIMGHSCGLSDRTMLKMIFEHDHCRAIKIFYYQNGNYNDYTDRTEEISRHFSDKGMMRKRITPFPDCRNMPQINPNVKSGYM